IEADHRSVHFVAIYVRATRNVLENGRPHHSAFAPAADEEPRTAVERLANPGMDARRLALADHRAHVDGFVERRSGVEPRRMFDECRLEALVHLLVHEDTLNAETILAGLRERAGCDRPNRGIEPRVRLDDHRRVRAELHGEL